MWHRLGKFQKRIDTHFRRVKEKFLGKRRLGHLFKCSHYFRERVPLRALKQAKVTLTWWRVVDKAFKEPRSFGLVPD